jgi:hypothetical protein
MGFQMNFSSIYLRLKNDKKFLMQFIFLCFISFTQIYSLWHQSHIERSLENLHQTNVLQEQRYQKINNNLANIARSLSENKNISQNELNNIDQELEEIKTDLHSKDSSDVVKTLATDVNEMKKLLTTQKSIAVNNRNQDLNQENKLSLSSISASSSVEENETDSKKEKKSHTDVSRHENSFHAKTIRGSPHYLSPKVLPFRVSSIDIWNGTKEATIYRGYTADLMGKGEECKGWRLVQMSFARGEVVFQNRRRQLVRVSLA